MASRLTRLAGIAAAVGALVTATAPMAAAEPHLVDQDVVNATVAIKTVLTAQMLIPDPDGGKAAWTSPVDIPMLCQGFFVDDKSSIATTTGCMSRSTKTLRRQIIRATAKGTFSDADVDRTTDIANDAGWTVRANEANPDSLYERKVWVKQVSQSATITDWAPALVVKVEDWVLGASSNALIRLSEPKTGLPFLRLAPTPPEIGQKITVFGLPDETITTTNPMPEPSGKAGTVVARPVSDKGVTQTQFSPQLSSGDLGGPALNERGEVVGIVNNFQPASSSDASANTVSDIPGLRAFLTQNGVNLADPTKGSGSPFGLIAAVVGGLVGLLLLGLIVMMVLRSKRKPAMAGPQFGAPPFGNAPGGPQPFGPQPQFPQQPPAPQGPPPQAYPQQGAPHPQQQPFPPPQGPQGGVNPNRPPGQ
ncbi:MAG: serine protease [Gordonia sp. (in: high G+C Gram-positive bacteria)]|uniref:S1 family peptidase n=1 Tax=Gordonia sp. (in: high G+C Gram-positive bacteria) TaxID=84139 RepID=UPI0039E37C86